MRYCWIWSIPVDVAQALAQCAGVIWCYFAHSWAQWQYTEEDDWASYKYHCKKCERKGGWLGYSC